MAQFHVYGGDTSNEYSFNQNKKLGSVLRLLAINDSIHYGKWLVEFWSEMSTLPVEVSSYMEDIFSHSITGNPYSCLPLDLWIEMIMNKGSKMKAGWKSILKNETMLHTYEKCKLYKCSAY